MSSAPTLAPDAAMVLGIASTALPFARTPDDEAERWLRVLRQDAVTRIAEDAARIASRRGAPGVATIDLLMAVMRVYGPAFDRVLRAHGTDRAEVLARLGVEMPVDD